MAKLSWTDQALEDLEAVCLFIARDAPRYGELFADRAFAAVERLGDFPLSGRGGLTLSNRPAGISTNSVSISV
ncbi:MAG: hypothetical protein DDT32_01974 [Syntrophomonadaceae bacterium]|nr:hypothetical protein [Bacillota bacterium]MBT9148204.1 hypothetical protein [Bacillota bacterium]